jgi:hypothetical protein
VAVFLTRARRAVACLGLSFALTLEGRNGGYHLHGRDFRVVQQEFIQYLGGFGGTPAIPAFLAAIYFPDITYRGFGNGLDLAMVATWTIH